MNGLIRHAKFDTNLMEGHCSCPFGDKVIRKTFTDHPGEFWDIGEAPADELSWAQIDNRKILRNALTCQYDCYPAEAIQQILG